MKESVLASLVGSDMRWVICMIFTLMLSPKAGSQTITHDRLGSTTTYDRRYWPDGPYKIQGRGVIACVSADATRIVNDPPLNERYGQATRAEALNKGGCFDFPDGFPVLILHANDQVTFIQPNIQGTASVLFAPSLHVTARDGLPAYLNNTDELPKVTWQEATQPGR